MSTFSIHCALYLPWRVLENLPLTWSSTPLAPATQLPAIELTASTTSTALYFWTLQFLRQSPNSPIPSKGPIVGRSVYPGNIPGVVGTTVERAPLRNIVADALQTPYIAEPHAIPRGSDCSLLSRSSTRLIPMRICSSGILSTGHSQQSGPCVVPIWN